MLGHPKRAARHWRNGLKFANKFKMQFDLLALSLASTNFEGSLTKDLALMSPKQLGEFATKLNITDPNWFRDWRLDRPTK